MKYLIVYDFSCALYGIFLLHKELQEQFSKSRILPEKSYKPAFLFTKVLFSKGHQKRNTRSVQKLSRILCFFKNYLFIHDYLFCPLQSNPHQILYLCQRFFQSSKHFKKSFFVILFSSSFDAVFISSIVAQRRPFMGLFSFGNKKKSQGARSGEYGGCGIISVFLAKNSRTSNDV